MAYGFIMPGRVRIGSRALNDSKEEIKALGNKAFIVTDKAMIRL